MIERQNRAAKKKESGNYFAKPKEDIEFIHSGSKLLDLALGGGWAVNRLSNVVGDKSSGKTLLAIEACANFAKKFPDGEIYYRESERAFLPDYAAALGMPIDRVNFNDSPFNTVKDVHDDLEKLVNRKKQAPVFYVLDSLDPLSSASDLERDFGDRGFGAKKAADMSELFRRLNGETADCLITTMIISQLRDNIGVMFGETKKRSGGNALDYYASQIVWLHQKKQIERTIAKLKRVTGLNILAKVKKNKVGLPFRDASFSIIFGYGVDDARACLEWLDLTKRAKDPSFGEPDKALEALNKMDDSGYFAELEKIHDAVTVRWYDIEQTLLPKRQKYGDRSDRDRQDPERSQKPGRNRQDSSGDARKPG